MRVRVRFSKFGSARFIGHLDIMRYFQKAFRRAGLPLCYSEGYHPHPILSFAQPLSLSFTSDGEYFDMELRDNMTEEALLQALNDNMCEDITINKVAVMRDFQLNEKKSTGMSLISGAYYAISLKDMPADLTGKLRDFSKVEDFLVEKTTKYGTKECNLSKGVHNIIYYHDGCFETLKESADFQYGIEEIRLAMKHASLFEDQAIVVSLDAGSERNISADLFLQGILKYAGYEEPKPLRTVHRMDLFGDSEGRKVPLWMIES